MTLGWYKTKWLSCVVLHICRFGRLCNDGKLIFPVVFSFSPCHGPWCSIYFFIFLNRGKNHSSTAFKLDWARPLLEKNAVFRKTKQLLPPRPSQKYISGFQMIFTWPESTAWILEIVCCVLFKLSECSFVDNMPWCNCLSPHLFSGYTVKFATLLRWSSKHRLLVV